MINKVEPIRFSTTRSRQTPRVDCTQKKVLLVLDLSLNEETVIIQCVLDSVHGYIIITRKSFVTYCQSVAIAVMFDHSCIEHGLLIRVGIVI